MATLVSGSVGRVGNGRGFPHGNVTGQAETAVETVEVEFDEGREDTALYMQGTTTVETLHRQKGHFFLHKEHRYDCGEDVSFEAPLDCEYECYEIPAAKAEAWLKRHCGQRDDVAQKIAKLDEQDGVGKRLTDAELKKRLLELAKSGAPRPGKNTVLGRALARFTTKP